ncbi:NUDIX hydrolase [uncultured Metabacillus sp.]|uniref:NUDIX hydrolase n=1 Tax=Metabacillus sp. Hm71 TaxID=3450743 RepID=UPI002614AD3C|nr:NUDIX domain-containing protein [uncultured Metabacillus sp.]
MEITSVYPAVTVIIFDKEGRILLQKRKDVGLWGLPSGHVEPGETVEQAAKREVFEETGLHIEIEKLIGVYSDPSSQVFYYPDGRVVHFITTYFSARIAGGKLHIDLNESLEVGFFSPQALPSNLLNMHPCWLSDALSDTERGYIR